MSKTGKHLVCKLNKEEVREWVETMNSVALTLAESFIVRSENADIDLSKVSDVDPKELSCFLDEKRIVSGVKIDFFLEE